jgi:chemotaxis protein CheZ
MPRSADPGLRDYLEQLTADGDHRISARELADIIGEVAQTLTADLQPLSVAGTEPSVAGNRAAAPGVDAAGALAALAEIVNVESGGRLAELKEELDEIRTSMQNAAAVYLSAAESIENIAAHPDMDADDQAQLYQLATDIYEASSFQDIGGQRLTRVTEILKELEFTVVRAQAVLGDDAADQSVDALGDAIERSETRKMEYFLHGPQNAGKANTQEEIDKILASFD